MLRYIVDETKPDALKTFQVLRTQFPATKTSQAKTIIPIGGDGTMLRAFHENRDSNKPLLFFGVVPQESNSQAFWLNRLENTKDLLERIKNCHRYLIHPLKMEIHFQNGIFKNRISFNNINIRRDGGQAALLTLKEHFGQSARETRIMGDGIIFSTPFGSSGANASAGGPLIDLSLKAFVMTGQAINDPASFNSRVYSADTIIQLSPISGQSRRPLTFDFDGRTESFAGHGDIKKIRITLATETNIQLGMTEHAGITLGRNRVPRLN